MHKGTSLIVPTGLSIVMIGLFSLSRTVRAACEYQDSAFVRANAYSLMGNDPDDLPVPHVLLANDYNGDGLVDLAALSRSYVEATLLFGNGDGTFRMPPSRYPFRTGREARDAFHEGMCDGDLDGDGDIDLAGVDWGRHELCLLFNNGDGVFSEPVVYFLFEDANPHGVIARDIDGDNDLDIVVTDDLGHKFSLFSNDGSGRFTLKWHTSTFGLRPQNMGVGDFDHDGDMDYAATNSGWTDGVDSKVAIFKNDSKAGPLGIPSFNGYLEGVPQESCSLAAIVNDLDEDGNLDLIISSWLQGVISICWGDGEGGFSAADKYFTQGTAVQPDVADFNQDGFKDIVVCLFLAPKLQVFWGRSERRFDDGPLLDVHTLEGAKPRFPALADFDRDGDIDIASVQYGLGNVVIFENQCPMGETFRRGDANTDGATDLSDAISILLYLFGPETSGLSCRDSADVNDDGAINLADAVGILGYLFAGAETFPLPVDICGTDPTDDDLDCASFPPCD